MSATEYNMVQLFHIDKVAGSKRFVSGSGSMINWVFKFNFYLMLFNGVLNIYSWILLDSLRDRWVPRGFVLDTPSLIMNV
jgi:hypothetical protein